MLSSSSISSLACNNNNNHNNNESSDNSNLQRKTAILVLGASDNFDNNDDLGQSRARAIVKDIMGVGASSSADGTVQPEEVSSDSALPVSIPWTIDTKYYTAKVRFWIDGCSTAPIGDDMGRWISSLSDAVDAFVFIYDKSKPSTFHSLAQWQPFLDAAAPNIQLCLAVSPSIPPGAQDQHCFEPADDHMDWCVANGFELIDLDEQPPLNEGEESSDSNSVGRTHSDSVGVEKYGIERVVEALQTNIWTSMVRKGRQILERVTHVCDDESAKEEVACEEKDDGETAYDEPANGNVSEDDDDARIFREAGMPTLEEAHRIRESLFGALDDDEYFERTVDQLRSLRGSRFGDEERRRLAARIAMSLTLTDD